MKKKIKNDMGCTDMYATKTFRKTYSEFLNTILLKYCNDPSKNVCSLGCYNDVLVDQIKFKELYLVDMKFGPCYHKTNIKIHYFEDTIENVIIRKDFQNCMDVIIMTTVVEHLGEKLLQFVFTHIKNMLTSDGIFIFTIPNARSVNRLIGVELGMLRFPIDLDEGDKAAGHKRMFSFNDINRFEKWLNLKRVENIGIMFKPLSNVQMDKYFGKNLETFIQIGRDLGPKVCSYVGGVFKNSYNKVD